MTDLPAGAYEHVITRGIERQLSGLDQDLGDRTQLDPAMRTRRRAETSGAPFKTVLGKGWLPRQDDLGGRPPRNERMTGMRPDQLSAPILAVSTLVGDAWQPQTDWQA